MTHTTTIKGFLSPVTFIRNLNGYVEDGADDWCKVKTSDGQVCIVRRSALALIHNSKAPIEPLESFPISDRRHLKPGHRFRPIAGSGPRYNDQPVGWTGRFVCRKIWQRDGKIYATAMSERYGGTYDLYLAGPEFMGSAGTLERPYKIKIL